MANADKPQSSYEEVLVGMPSLDGIRVFHNEVLVATYMQPAIRASGLIMPDQVRDEDKWQGKVGIVLKKGPLAFKDNATIGAYFEGQDVQPGDMIVYRVSDGFPTDIDGIHCRLLQDTEIRLIVPDPTIVF